MKTITWWLMAYGAGMINHYRADKMMRITATEDPRFGRETFKAFDRAKYSKSMFGMFK